MISRAFATVLLLWVCGDGLAQTGGVPVWTRWEQSLTASKTYANPYADVTVAVTWTGPGGRSFSSYAFWDGGSTFRIRCAFPAAGTWTWKTSSSDAADVGLHHRTGSVSVTSYSGTNPLYRRGFLKVAPGRRHLEHDDEMPFLWMGDTAWVAPLKASLTDWQTYVDDRVAKKFSVLLVSPASSWGGTADTSGNAPFLGSGLAKWNPVYWQGFEEKVEAANEKGLAVLVVGLMKPTTGYPTSAEAKLFARNLVARMHGDFVLFSPSFDDPYKTLGDDVGTAVADATVQHLVMQHPGTDIGAVRSYYDKAYLDFCGVQSGHNLGNRETCAAQAIQWNLEMYGRHPAKPVVNLEAFYDAAGTVPTLGGEYQGTAKDARQLGYLSWCSGSLGYTYGAYGLWNWETDTTKANHWAKAAAYASSAQMRHMAAFFGGIEWWRLEPAHSLIQNQPAAYLSRRVLAKSPGGDLAVAYMPDGDGLTLSMASFCGTTMARWYDPVGGCWTDVAGTFPNSGTRTFRPPASGDWLLLFTP